MSSDEEDSWLVSTSQEGSEQFDAHLAHLTEIFPTKVTAVLSNALEETSDLESAISYIMGCSTGRIIRRLKIKFNG